MTILEELITYSHNCINDVRVSENEDYISCKKHKNACKRFLRDVERSRSDDCPFYWSEDEANKIIVWFSYLRHSQGSLAGQPIILTTWQKFLMCQLYGWRNKKTGYKRFHKLFCEVGRKNAKSQMMAGMMLYEISVMATRNQEIYEAYTTGTRREQSRVIFDECKHLLDGSPLKTKFRITNTVLTHVKTGSFLKMLSKQDKKEGDGTNPAVLCIDEYHQHKTDEYLALFLGCAAKDGTMIIITTAGMDLSYPCYTTEYKYTSDILDPNKITENDEYLIDILEVDKPYRNNLKDFSDERIWWMANPIRMSYETGRDQIRAAFQEALDVPRKLITFLTKVFNIWVQSKENGYMHMGKWRACIIKEEDIPIDTRGMQVIVGFDMSSKVDLTSVSFIVPFQDKEDLNLDGEPIVKYILWSHSFIPSREALNMHITVDKQPYDLWERMGYLTVTETPIVDQSSVMRYVLDFVKEHGWEIEVLAFDPANASKIMMDLSEKGFDVEEVFQSHKSLNEATNGFREQVYSRNVYVVENPLLTYAMGNAVVKVNNGLIKIDKDQKQQRVDPVDSTLCAFKLALYHDFTPVSITDAVDAWLDSI